MGNLIVGIPISSENREAIRNAIDRVSAVNTNSTSPSVENKEKVNASFEILKQTLNDLRECFKKGEIIQYGPVLFNMIQVGYAFEKLVDVLSPSKKKHFEPMKLAIIEMLRPYYYSTYYPEVRDIEDSVTYTLSTMKTCINNCNSHKK